MAITIAPVVLGRNSNTIPTTAMTFSTAHALYSASTAAEIDISGYDGSKIVFVVQSTAATTGEILVKAGSFTAKGVGNAKLKSTGVYIPTFFGPFETARFKSSAGKIELETTGADTKLQLVTPIVLP